MKKIVISIYLIFQIISINSMEKAIDIKKKYKYGKRIYGERIYHIFKTVKKSKNSSIISYYGRKHVVLSDLIDRKGYSALHYAIYKNNRDHAIALLACIPELINIPEPKTGLMPVELALAKGAFEVLEAFTEIATIPEEKNKKINNQINHDGNGNAINPNYVKILAIAASSTLAIILIAKILKEYFKEKEIEVTIDDFFDLDTETIRNKKIKIID